MAQTGGLRSFAGTRASGEKRGDHSFVTRGLVMHWPAVLASANANASCDHFEKTLAATFHPELSTDTRVHELFLAMVKERKKLGHSAPA